MCRHPQFLHRLCHTQPVSLAGTQKHKMIYVEPQWQVNAIRRVFSRTPCSTLRLWDCVLPSAQLHVPRRRCRFRSAYPCPFPCTCRPSTPLAKPAAPGLLSGAMSSTRAGPGGGWVARCGAPYHPRSRGLALLAATFTPSRRVGSIKVVGRFVVMDP